DISCKLTPVTIPFAASPDPLSALQYVIIGDIPCKLDVTSSSTTPTNIPCKLDVTSSSTSSTTPTTASPVPSSTQRKCNKKVVCWYILSNMDCPYGESCWFSHE
ncbi:hypothetical protein L195_g057096, partial [Trifolium pratense]